MSINMETALALLLLPIIVGIPSAAGQIDDSLSLPLESLEDLTDSSLVNASDVSDLVGNVTEITEDVIDDSLSLPLESLEDLTGSPLVGGADDTSSVAAGDTTLVNEVELNPRGNDEEEWIELYNPTAVDINISGFEINPLFQSPTIELPLDAVIEAGETYVIELDRSLLSNTGESLVLANATGDVKDRTPSLVDRSDDDRTWQRIPDGNNEWQFVEDTQGSLNDPDTSSTATPDNVEDTQGSLNDPDTLSRILENAFSGSDVECLGSAGCFEGVATRVADGDTLYVDVNGTEYKVDLALIEAPSRTEEMFIESTEFTRDLCLGSTVLVDQDDMQLTSNSAVIAVVYCSSSNLNNELLDNDYASLETAQCTTSEFANQPWARDNGC
ncbi:MAG: lamin tail domain-containing protein [Thermoproteota archaeon]|jgi:endonuclease YncB( thermonuclease family)|nr:lamin tail domain-containing protein [Thermoproteota archaeon]